MKGAWLFDLDGTLADTDRDIRGAWKAALRDLGLECPDFDDRFVTGPPIDEVVRTLFPGSCDDRLIADVRAGFGRHYDGDGFPATREYPGVLDAVRRIRSAGFTVLIATNKRHAGATAMAARFGWMSVFDGLYAGDMHMDDPAVGKLRKPELLRLILRERGLSAADCTMVGDTVSDFEAARANGIRSIGVTWGYGTPGELALADMTVSSPDELVGILRGDSP